MLCMLVAYEDAKVASQGLTGLSPLLAPKQGRMPKTEFYRIRPGACLATYDIVQPSSECSDSLQNLLRCVADSLHNRTALALI